MGKELLDASGLPVSEDCPKCGAEKKEQQEIKSFGGHRRVVCIKCGCEINRWREDHVEKV
jgi:predicted nucleic-acid-binding Zn-ribbon protein